MESVLSDKYGEARERYLSLLGQKRIAMRDFYHEMIRLIDLCPSFHASYLEILEHLEGRLHMADYRNFLKTAASAVMGTYMGADKNAREKIAQMNYHEIHALYWLVRRIAPIEKNLIGGKWFASYRMAAFQGIVSNAYASMSLFSTNTHLRRIRASLPVVAMVKDIQIKEHYWYESTARQEDRYNHRHTQTIFLREVLHNDRRFVPVDGPHESVMTEAGKVFGDILSFVERFAEAENSGLGRVAVVRLRPKSVVYRHYDDSERLIGRQRFHLVLFCKPGNLLMSGVDFAAVAPGELWYYDNKVPHRSVNDSDGWRTHVIFDMYPLGHRDDGNTAGDA